MIVRIIDGDIGATYVAEQLQAAGIECTVHSPNNPRARARYAPYPSMSISLDQLLIERHIGDVLGTYRGIFLISSYAGSLIANSMIDLCGQSNNIITCDKLDCGNVPVAATKLSVNIYKKQRQLARIARRVPHHESDHEFIIADNTVQALSYPELVQKEDIELNNKPKFLSSPSLIVAAKRLGIKSNTYHNYAGLVKEFLAAR